MKTHEIQNKATDWEKIFTKRTSNKGPMSRTLTTQQTIQ